MESNFPLPMSYLSIIHILHICHFQYGMPMMCQALFNTQQMSAQYLNSTHSSEKI